MKLYCLTSIQRIKNCESRHDNTETACTIQTNGRDLTAGQIQFLFPLR